MMRIGILVVAALALAVPCFAQAGSKPAAENTLNIPSDQGIVAKLVTELDSTKDSVGDSVQAETTRDIKRGHDMLLKKGATLSGKIVKIDAGGHDSPAMIAILFDQVTPKGEQAENLNVQIQAIAPPPGVSTNSLQDGRGMMQTDINVDTAGGKGIAGNGGEVLATSTGVIGIPGMNIGTASSNGKQLSVIGTGSGSIKLKKGTQLVFKAPEQ
jgi:hypothetical protein